MPGELPEDVDTLGTVLLIALVVVLGAFSAVTAAIATVTPSRGLREGLVREGKRELAGLGLEAVEWDDPHAVAAGRLAE